MAEEVAEHPATESASEKDEESDEEEEEQPVPEPKAKKAKQATPPPPKAISEAHRKVKEQHAVLWFSLMRLLGCGYFEAVFQTRSVCPQAAFQTG